MSLFGYDIALFHAYIKEIDDSIIAIARLEESIVLFGKHINILFLVISSITQPQKHIETLSTISKFILKPENRKLLQEVKSSEQLLKVFF